MDGSMSASAAIKEIVERLVRALQPDRIYLFGSRARDDADEGSDFDLLVVVRDSDLPGHHRDRAALRALRGLAVPVDVLVLTRREFDGQAVVACSLPATVLREGKLLHAA